MPPLSRRRRRAHRLAFVAAKACFLGRGVRPVSVHISIHLRGILGYIGLCLGIHRSFWAGGRAKWEFCRG